jgi:hypothetical protein
MAREEEQHSVTGLDLMRELLETTQEYLLRDATSNSPGALSLTMIPE